MGKKNKKSFKSIIITTIIILLITNIFLSVHYFISLSKHQRGDAYLTWYGYVYWPKYENKTLRNCIWNIRDLELAVDCYNMDATETMTVLDIDKLIEEGYLKNTPTTSYSKCKYILKGDLAENGEIYCELHGSFSEIEQKMEIEKKENERMYTLYFYGIRLLPAVLYFIFALM